MCFLFVEEVERVTSYSVDDLKKALRDAKKNWGVFRPIDSINGGTQNGWFIQENPI